MNKQLLYDRSRVVQDWKCPYSRYLCYEYEGRGIVSDGLALDLFTGSVIHDSLAAIAHGVGIDDIAQAAVKQMLDALLPQVEGEIDGEEYAREQAALVEGLIRGFYKHVWPRLIAQYPNILLIEEELTYEHNGMTFMCKPDIVMSDNEGIIVYPEYKSTSSKKEEWINSWNTAVQLHSTVKAIEKRLNEKVTSVMVVGLYKGYRSYNKQNSPFCYCYSRPGNPPFSQDTVLYEYKAGFKRTPTWTMEGGVKAWVEGMPENLLAEQFPMTPPIFIKEDLVNAFFNQRKYREQEIKLAMQMLEVAEDQGLDKSEIMDVTFPQRFDQCQPGWGHSCPYRKICHGQVSEPLKEGFSYRTAHHILEAEQQEQGNEQTS